MAMLLSQPSNMERRTRMCMMPQDQTPGVDLCMRGWQDLFLHTTPWREKFNTSVCFCRNWSQKCKWNCFPTGWGPTQFQYRFDFFRRPCYMIVELKCWTNKVSQRFPCTSELFCDLRENINAALVTCLVHCMSAALQTLLTLTVTVGARQLWEIFCILRKYFYCVSYFMTCFILNDPLIYMQH